ncbi:MAG TPA: acyltransferase [Pseudobdellovibrionaceae bacterium]|nr:acyltransferase [Pseudobdellovibrionaceae bacterium]
MNEQAKARQLDVWRGLDRAARYGLALIYLVFGLNGFFLFIPVPPMPEVATQFMAALRDSGYLLSLVKALEVICAILLFSGRFLPATLTVLAPITLNIFLFHIFLTPGFANWVVQLAMLLAHLYLLVRIRASLRVLFISARDAGVG